METILITGGTGLIGKRLSVMLADKGYNVVVLTRQVFFPSTDPRIKFVSWDPEREFIENETLQQADHIIHLAGAGVMDKRWNDSYKKQILHSRVKSGEFLMKALANGNHRVKTLICSSAIGWYGADLQYEHSFIETDKASADFLGQTCLAWENSITKASSMGIRTCFVRTGIVLSKDGGALKEFMKPLKFGIAGILGSGRQIISWIHIDDLCRIFMHLLENHHLSGPYNAVAPYPVSNGVLVKTLAKKKNGKWYFPLHVPSFMLKLMIGEGSIEILKSTSVSSKKIVAAGFQFKFETIEDAINEILN